MKIIIIRHGDPDYEKDSLTDTGWKEANALVPYMKKLNEQQTITAFYQSPLGRAQHTAQPTLQALGRSAKTCEWLQEFPAKIMRPDVPEHAMIAWDWLPEDWTRIPEFYDPIEWKNVPQMKEGGVGSLYDSVADHFDQLLASHGYRREENYYRVEKSSNDTIVLFCHLGLECVLLSRLTNCSPMILWHHFFIPPASVTTVISEERREGIASFRVRGLGDTSHLYAAEMEPSFSGRFCECYSNEGERHD